MGKCTNYITNLRFDFQNYTTSRKLEKSSLVEFLASNFKKKINNDINANNIFLVFNTACFGDVLLCNSLCQNIKLNYPNSKIVFIANKPFKEVAKYQKDVDEVVVFDKKGIHKGLLGCIKFIKEFPYKKPFASFITYQNERNFLICKLLGSRHIFMNKALKKIKLLNSVQFLHSKLLEPIATKTINNFPIKYNAPVVDLSKFNNVLTPLKKYIALSSLSKNCSKDMYIKSTIELIKKLNKETDYEIIYTGVGEKALKTANILNKENCKFINLVNKTTILELSNILKKCQLLISVDTGTMHLGYALGVKTLCIFYRNNTEVFWAPDSNLYKNTKVLLNPNTDEIIEEVINGN